jgi:hypothetical protein
MYSDNVRDVSQLVLPDSSVMTCWSIGVSTRMHADSSFLEYNHNSVIISRKDFCPLTYFVT